MDEQKLNKKLAEWAGFQYLPYKGEACEAEAFGGRPVRDGYVWVHPDWVYGNDKWNVELPDFTQSLDVCFKWLVPKLYEKGYYYDLIQWNERQHKAIINKCTVGWTVTASDAVAETPALALCLAIIKLIEKDIEKLIDNCKGGQDAKKKI